MKSAFPNLKQILSTPNSANGRRRSMPKSMPDVSFTTDHACLNFSATPVKGKFSLHHEITKIEKKLDSDEIELKNLKIFDEFTIETEFKNYIEYLNEICLCIRHKDPKLSNSILRGVIACEKTVKKIFARQVFFLTSSKEPSLNSSKIDNFSQTDEEIKFEKPLKFCSTPELESFKQLGATFRKIKVSRLTGQLCDLYDSLSKMYTDVPEPTATPEPEDFDFSDPHKILQLHFNIIKKNINQVTSTAKNEMKKLMIDKMSQDDFPPSNAPHLKVLETMVQEKEFELKKVKKRLQIESEQKKNVEENLAKIKNFYTEVEKQHNTIEIEAVQLKNKNVNSEMVIAKQERRINFLVSKLEKKTKKLIQAKIRIGELKAIIVQKQQKMNKLQDELFDVKISWKICEEKLLDIEKQWERKVGSKFSHKEVTIEAIINKYKIAKAGLEDEKEFKIMQEIDSDVSENEDPEVKELETIQKSRKELLKIENLKISASSKKIEPSTPKGNSFVGFQIIQEKKFVNESSESDEVNQENKEVLQNKKRKKKSKKTTKIENKSESEDEESFEEDSESEEDFDEKGKEQAKNSKYKENNSKASETVNLSQKQKKNESLQLIDLSISDNLSSSTPKTIIKKNYTFSKQAKNGNTFLSNTPQSKDSKVSKFQARLSKNLNFSVEIRNLDGKEIEELIKLEKDYEEIQSETEKQLFESFEPSQMDLYKKYKSITEELNRVRKLLGILMKSKSIQCIFDDSQSFANVKSTNFGGNYKSGIDLSSKTSDLKYFNSKLDPLESLKNNLDAQKLLNSVFEDESQLNATSLKTKLEIVNMLKGHTSEKCKEMCPHLLRVLKLKWKIKGIPYPLKNILMQSTEF